MHSLAVYIHWPFCKAKCPYCDFNSHVRERVEQDRWRNALLRELEHMATLTPNRRVTSIFFGGGTPSLMPASTVEALIDRAGALWPVADDIEITLEANPTSVETHSFPDFKQAGVNRVSLGVQSLQADELKFLGREHSVDEAMQAIELARRTFERYSFDLIYARPNQTLAGWEAELTQALELAGSHLSLYQLTIEENTAFHHAYARGGFTLPDEAQAEALYRLTESLMAKRGLYAYEVSNYAAPGQESRHNLAYWQGTDYIGVGPGAHGRLTLDLPLPLKGGGRVGVSSSPPRTPHPNPPPSRGRGKRTATATLKSPERWLEAVERSGHAIDTWQEIGRQQEVEERLMMGLRLSAGIGYDAFGQQTGFDIRPYLNAAKIRLYRQQGLLEDSDDRLQTSLSGRLVLGTLTGELLG